MIAIRRRTFETNSSSTHSIVICMEDAYNSFMSGKSYLYEDKGKFCDRNISALEELMDKYNIYWIRSEVDNYKNGLTDIEDFENNLSACGIYTAENFWSQFDDDFEQKFTSEHGDKIVAFGKYGYDY